jgi:tetratricopeptide (TPR) repeat protein
MAEVRYNQLLVCGHCGQETPNYEDCIQCGRPLQPDAPPRELDADDLQTMMMGAKLQEIQTKRKLAYADAWDHAPWLDRLYELAEIAPDHPKVQLYIGAAYMETGRFRDAIVSLTRALIADPDLADAYRRRADCQYILVPVLGGDTQAYYDRAVADYEVALELDPDAYTYNAHATIVGSLGEWETAIEEYGQAIALAPEYTESFFNRGYAHKVLGHTEAAIADLERFLGFEEHWNEELVAQAQAHIKELRDAELP